MAPKFKTTKKRTEHAMGNIIANNSINGTNGTTGGFNNNLIRESSKQETQQLQSQSQPQQLQPQQKSQPPPTQSQPQLQTQSQPLPKPQLLPRPTELPNQPTPPQSQQHPPQQQLQSNNQQQQRHHDLNGNVNQIVKSSQGTSATSTDLKQTYVHEATREVAQSTQTTATPSPMPPPSQSIQGSAQKETYYSYKASPAASTFTWEEYLKLQPAPVAPKEAFRQATTIPKNQFEVGMKLEAKDPRNSSNWCLASVILVEGLHLRLRFVGADKMNDLYELIDSENIRPVGSSPSDLLLAPTGFTGNIAQYPKFVEKVLRDESTIIAPPEYFPPTPPKPPRNLFERGMKLEAVDLKNRDFICPATIGAVDGDRLLIMFDGWKGSFDYRCDYYSRDLFPINWCRDLGRAIQPPNGWTAMLEGVFKYSMWSPSSTPDLKPSRSSQPTTPVTKTKIQTQTPTSTTKKPRGRPRKNPIQILTHIQRDKVYTPRPMSSTPKKQPPPPPADQSRESPISSLSPQPLDGLMNTTDISDDGANIDRFQCQRTVSYDEWQKRKLEEQMPRVGSLNDVKDVGDTSLNLSDTTSMASTLSSNNRRDSAELPDQGNCPKRAKVDNDNPCVPSELRRLLDSKPAKLSLWTVEDVLDIIKTERSLIKYIDIFQENEIDGKAFGLFDPKKQELLMSMGLKLGPVLKILNLREQLTLYVDTSDIVLR